MPVGWWLVSAAKRERRRIDPDEEAAFKVKTGPRKACGCEKPCDCISNTQAKRAARQKSAVPEKKVAPPQPKKAEQPAKKTKKAAPAETKKTERSNVLVNVIEVSTADAEENTLEKNLPDEWRTLFESRKDDWEQLSASERKTTENNLKALVTNYRKLKERLKELKSLPANSLGRNKFAVFEEADEEEKDECEQMLELMNSGQANALAKINILNTLIQQVKMELYKLGDIKEQNKTRNPPNRGVRAKHVGLYEEEIAAGVRPGVEPKRTKKTNAKQKKPVIQQDYIPGLPAGL